MKGGKLVGGWHTRIPRRCALIRESFPRISFRQSKYLSRNDKVPFNRFLRRRLRQRFPISPLLACFLSPLGGFWFTRRATVSGACFPLAWRRIDRPLIFWVPPSMLIPLTFMVATGCPLP
ncbi:MAG: hypothetical protein NTX04_14515 [Verrucomicrobia bacterium]|nr:hypothetical protein [Verrucomicrobiota bacterium]